jgi:hypothetical protein
MKKQITFFIVFILFVVSNMCAQTQNNIWSLPPNYYDFSTANLQALPTSPFGYDGTPAKFGHNAMQDANGELLFFIVDNTIYDKDGLQIDFFPNINTPGQEISIVPDPSSCERYYIFYSGVAPYYGILDLTVPWIVEQGPVSSIVPILGINWVFQTDKTSGHTIVSSQLNENNERFIYSLLRSVVVVYKIDNSGISSVGSFPIDTGYITSDSLLGTMEMVKISPTVSRLAFSYRVIHNDQNNPPIRAYSQVTYTDINNTTGLPIMGTVNTFKYPDDNNQPNSNKPFIHGLEFSPDGEYIYITHDKTTIVPSSIDIYQVGVSSNPIPVANIPAIDAEDFENSEIELGRDGNLYFAGNNNAGTNNRLASFSNPSNPISGTWTNNALQLSYNFVQPKPNFEGSKIYTLPDQIDGMDYNDSFLINPTCCLENAPFDIDEYQTNGTQTWYPWSNPWTTTGVVTVRDKLVIPTGSNITINYMNFEFAPGAQLIVEDGAQLRIDNTRFTVNTDCTSDAMWRGVEVWGNGSFQPATSGKFIATNSSIENAIEGVVNYRHDVSNGPASENVLVSGYTGGIIQLIDTRMLNNKFDINMTPYQASISNTPINDSSFFKNCNFITDDLLNDTSQLPLFTHVKLNGVDGIRFLGCTFENSAPAGAYAYSNRGMGIFAQETKFSVNASCNANVTYPTPCPSPNASTFTNLTFGISAVSNNGLKTARIINSEFQDVFRGVRLIGLDAADVSNNTFDVGANSNATVSYGLTLIQCDGYKVENNDFHTSFDGYLGCGVINSGEGANEIYRNTFTGLKVGSQASQNNGDGESAFSQNGLEFRCNTYTDIKDYDILVSSGRIRSDQGNCIPTNVKSPANNQFSYTAQYGDYWLNDPPVVSITSTYHYSQDGTMYNLEPRLSNINLFNTSEQVCANLPSFNIEQSCPLREEKTITVLKNEKEELQSEIRRITEHNEVSEDEELQSVVSFLEASIRRIDNEIIRQLLFNVDSDRNFNDVADFLQKNEENNNITENQLLIKALIANEDFVDARQKLNELNADLIDANFYKLMHEEINKQQDRVKDGTIVKIASKRIPLIKIEKGVPQSISKDLVEEASVELFDINIYPNPAKEQFQIEHTIPLDNGDIELIVFNMIGNKLIIEKVNNTKITVNTSSLKTGLYFYTITQNNKLIKSDKLIIK